LKAGGDLVAELHVSGESRVELFGDSRRWYGPSGAVTIDEESFCVTVPPEVRCHVFAVNVTRKELCEKYAVAVPTFSDMRNFAGEGWFDRDLARLKEFHVGPKSASKE
jgi:hypothetical protein